MADVSVQEAVEQLHKLKRSNVSKLSVKAINLVLLDYTSVGLENFNLKSRLAQLEQENKELKTCFNCGIKGCMYYHNPVSEKSGCKGWEPQAPTGKEEE